MENQLTSNWYLQTIKGVLLILLAILVFMSPEGALLAWAVYYGVAMVVVGIVILIAGFSGRGVIDNWGWRVFEGIIDIIFGIILLANPAVTAAVLPFVVGFWGSIYGVMLVVDAFAEEGNRGIKVVFGILLFLSSFVFMFNPLFAGLSLAVWFGVILLIAGIYNFIDSFSHR